MPLYLAGTFLITAFAVSITIFFIIQKRKQVKSFLEQQQLKFDFENALLTARIEVQDQTFETVSRDIHDGLGQVLSLGCVQLADLKNYVDNEQTLNKLDDTLQLFKKAVKDMRLLSHSLNTGLVEHRELRQSVITEFNRIEAFSGIRCTIEMQEDDTMLTPQQRLVIFRIIQEALQNILKHAQASTIRLSLEQFDGNMKMQLVDNGIGFDMSHHEMPTSLGLLSMAQRAKMLNAELTINSSLGSGTVLTLLLPLKKPI